MTPGQLDEWMAADALGQMVGLEKLYTVMSLIGSTLVNSWGGTTRPENFIPKPPADCRQADRAENQEVSPNQMAAAFTIASAGAGLGQR